MLLAARLYRYLLRRLLLVRPAARPLSLLGFLRRHYELRRFARSLQRPHPGWHKSHWVNDAGQLCRCIWPAGDNVAPLIGPVVGPSADGQQLLIAQS